MKKILLFIIIFLLALSLIYKKNRLQPVFNENDDEIFQYIYVYRNNMDINNMYNYIKDIKIISIVPLINPVYRDCISIKYKNNYDFKEVYLNYLKEKGYYSEYNKYLVEPIKIKKILVYSSLKLIKKYSLEYTLDNSFICKN